MTTPYNIVHDESYAEEHSQHQYLVIKVFDSEEIGQIKLELVNDKAHDGPTIKLHVTGDIKRINIVNPEKLEKTNIPPVA